MNVARRRHRKARAAHLGPERRRPQVLDAALEIASERGVRGVSMDSVAQRLGVSRPVIYSCFASREELLSALLQREEQRLFEGVMAALPERFDISDPQRAMIQGFQAFLGVVAEYTPSWQLVFSPDPDPAVSDRYGQGRALVARQVGALMKQVLRANGVSDVERKLPVLVEQFMSMGDGAVRSLLQNESQWTPAELGEYVGRLVYSALRKA